MDRQMNKWHLMLREPTVWAALYEEGTIWESVSIEMQYAQVN